MVRRISAMRAALILAGALSTLGCGTQSTPTYEASFLSRIYPIDQIYRSMMGPQARQIVRIGDTNTPELVWITGYRSEIVSSDSGDVTSPEFMCHSNLRFGQMPAHRALFKWKRAGRPRLFTLSQGQMGVRFPEGYGVPMISTEFLQLDTQVLNLNDQDEALSVQHKTTIQYVRDVDAPTPLKPLFQQSAQGMVLLAGDDPYFGVEMPDPDLHGPGCMVGAQAGERVIRDRFDREFAAHWIVPPGRQVNRTLVTEWMKIPFDTRIHHIAVHVHPYSESVELRDLTSGETVFMSRASQSSGRIGLETVEEYSDPEGIPIYKDHEYELISIYDNTSGEPQDAMAVMFMYMHDRQFVKPSVEAIAAAQPPKAAPPKRATKS